MKDTNLHQPDPDSPIALLIRSVCKLCEKEFLSEEQLKKHVDIKHLNRAEEYKKECGICHTKVQQVQEGVRHLLHQGSTCTRRNAASVTSRFNRYRYKMECGICHIKVQQVPTRRNAASVTSRFNRYSIL